MLASLPRFLLPSMLLLVGSVAQASDSLVQIELNKLEANGNACRAYLVVENDTESAFEELKIDVVMFDTEGIVARRLAVQIAPLAAGKTSLKVFDVADLQCNQLGRMLLNDVMACSDAAGVRDDCLGFVTTSARGSVDFIK